MDNEHAACIADIIKFSTLKMLFIAWNKIRSKGGVMIFNALKDNNYIQVFDASFNSLAANSIQNYGNIAVTPTKISTENLNCSKCAISLNNMFLENSTLIHMDLSHNNFSMEDCKEISKGLNQNKSVLGLHMSGNYRDTNALGFINKLSSPDPGIAHVHTRIHESLETGVLSEKRRQFKASSN